jgi:hypothetical protein
VDEFQVSAHTCVGLDPSEQGRHATAETAIGAMSIVHGLALRDERGDAECQADSAGARTGSLSHYPPEDNRDHFLDIRR